MAKYSVSIIESKKNKKRYLDLTSKSVPARMKEINKGGTDDKFLNANKPFKAIYTETYKKKEEAEERIEFMRNEARVTIDLSKE